MLKPSVLVAVCITLLALPAAANDYKTQTVLSGLEHPWSIAFLPDGRWLVTERPGRLRLIDAQGQLRDKPLSGLPDDIYNGGQAGLMDVVPAPDFAESRRVFISYACGTYSRNHLCLGHGRIEDGALSRFREIIRTQPGKEGNAHFGGRIVFLPDGTLLLTVGDGFDYREQAQNTANHLGAILRLRQDGQPPSDNPFVGDAEAADAIYSYGHRNPQGIVYDPETQRVISNEHGPRGGDEINIIRPGENYGWPVVTHGVDYTGALVTPFTEKAGMIAPMVHWTPSIAPSGLALYRGELFPQWRGDLFSGALAARRVQRARMKDGRLNGQESLLTELDRRIRDVRTGPRGALILLTDHADGEILRVVPAD